MNHHMEHFKKKNVNSWTLSINSGVVWAPQIYILKRTLGDSNTFQNVRILHHLPTLPDVTILFLKNYIIIISCLCSKCFL